VVNIRMQQPDGSSSRVRNAIPPAAWNMLMSADPFG
jgi:hypothetical protein